MPRDHWDHEYLNPRGATVHRLGQSRRPQMGPARSSARAWLIASALAGGLVFVGNHARELNSRHAPTRGDEPNSGFAALTARKPPETVAAYEPGIKAQFPTSGRELRHEKFVFSPANAPLSIDATTIPRAHAVVRIYEWSSDRPIATIYLDRGAIHETFLAPGDYRLRMAYGDRWQGDEKLFGLSTEVSRTERPITMTYANGTRLGHKILLVSPTGNLPANPENAWRF